MSGVALTLRELHCSSQPSGREARLVGNSHLGQSPLDSTKRQIVSTVDAIPRHSYVTTNSGYVPGDGFDRFERH